MERVTPRELLRRSAIGVLLLTLALTGCRAAADAPTGSSDGAGVVGIALPATADATWSRGGDALARELSARGYRLDLQFAASDARTQGAQVRNMLTKGVDAVILAPLETAELTDALAAAADEGVPVVEYGRALAGIAAGAAFVADPADLGRAQAETLLADLAEAPAVSAPSQTPGAPASPSASATDASEAPDAAPPDATASPAAPPATSGVATPEPARLAIVAATADGWEAARYAAALDALQPAVADGRLRVVSGATSESADVGGVDAEAQADAAEERVRALRAGDAAEAPTAVLALGDAVTRGVVTALTTDPPVEETASPTPSPGDGDGADPVDAVPAPLVVGSGADPVTVRALRDGAIDATAFADPRALVGATADAVEALLGDRAVDAGGGVPGIGGVAGDVVSPSILRADDVEELIASGWISTGEL